MMILTHYLSRCYRNNSFYLFIVLMVVSVGVLANPCPPVNKRPPKDDTLGETVFYAATVRRDKQLQICAKGEKVTYIYTITGQNGLPETQLRRFSLNNVAWVYMVKRETDRGIVSKPARVGLILYEQSIEYDIMTGNNFNVPFSTLVVRDKSSRREKVRFDPASVINNIVAWSQKHDVRKTTEPRW